MGTIDERKMNDDLVDTLVELSSNGNKEAKNYLSLFAYVIRVFDDLIDKDYPVSDAQICRAFFILMAELWMNPFFLRNHRLLIPLHIASVNAFMDSNVWLQDKDELKKMYAHVIKDFVNEILGMVAFLTGGYNHMRNVSLKMRELFIEDPQQDAGIKIQGAQNGQF